MFNITKEFLLLDGHSYANLGFLILSLRCFSAFFVTVKDVFPCFHIWMCACCVTQIMLTPAWPGWLHLSFSPPQDCVALCFRWPLRFCSPFLWDCTQPCGEKHASPFLILHCFHVFYRFYRVLSTWVWRLLVLGCATSGVLVRWNPTTAAPAPAESRETCAIAAGRLSAVRLPPVLRALHQAHSVQLPKLTLTCTRACAHSRLREQCFHLNLKSQSQHRRTDLL